MKNLHIKLSLLTPVLLTDGFLTLDGLLSVAHENMTGGNATEKDIPIAFESGIARASSAYFERGDMSAVRMFARFSPGEMRTVYDQSAPSRASDKFILNQDSGKYKSAFTTFTSLNTPAVHWYCVGDAHAIRRLLGFIEGVGRKASLGWGAIDGASILVEEIPQDCSWRLYGTPARPLPADLWQQAGGGPAEVREAVCGYPYWSDEKVLAAVPTDRIMPVLELAGSKVRP